MFIILFTFFVKLTSFYHGKRIPGKRRDILFKVGYFPPFNQTLLRPYGQQPAVQTEDQRALTGGAEKLAGGHDVPQRDVIDGSTFPARGI
jgi:hypothetical protein